MSKPNKLSQIRCPKCNYLFLFWTWKAIGNVGYSCQTCGYNFMIGEISFRQAGRGLRDLVLENARSTLSRKGF